MADFIKTPRLYVDSELSAGLSVVLDKGQSHYLTNVMRRREGDHLRLFNGRDGEWGAVIAQLSKKEVVLALDAQLREQPAIINELHLIFAPIKKQRMDFLVEKAVELGATHLHPVITHHTELRKLNMERIRAQIVEAAEQCERLDMPVVSEPVLLEAFLSRWNVKVPIAACIERNDYSLLGQGEDIYKAILIGPEGGFDLDEIDVLRSHDFIAPISLGKTIMRAETAALYALSLCRNHFDK